MQVKNYYKLQITTITNMKITIYYNHKAENYKWLQITNVKMKYETQTLLIRYMKYENYKTRNKQARIKQELQSLNILSEKLQFIQQSKFVHSANTHGPV